MRQNVASFILSVATYFISFTWMGGRDSTVNLLLACMIADYLTGFLVSVICKNSTKTSTGSYSSSICFVGLCKKAMILGMVWIVYLLQEATGFKGIRDIVVIGFAINEMMSLIENFGLMGIPIPKPIMQCLDVLQNRENEYQIGGSENVE